MAAYAVSRCSATQARPNHRPRILPRRRRTRRLHSRMNERIAPSNDGLAGLCRAERSGASDDAGCAVGSAER